MLIADPMPPIGTHPVLPCIIQRTDFFRKTLHVFDDEAASSRNAQSFSLASGPSLYSAFI
jgi:hypothetical protein